jgi:hypothetical protein
VTTQEPTSQEPLTEGTSADHSRSGEDIAEAIEVAERGSSVQDVHDDPESTKTGTARVEQTRDDPEMTEGQVAYGSGEESGESGEAAEGTTPAATDSSSGVAQSVVAGRTSDRVASGDESTGG